MGFLTRSRPTWVYFYLNATLEQRIETEVAAYPRMETALHQAQKMEAVGQL
jgi:hypothetical protein